jgi:hypothetical protein
LQPLQALQLVQQQQQQLGQVTQQLQQQQQQQQLIWQQSSRCMQRIEQRKNLTWTWIAVLLPASQQQQQ